MSETGAHAAKAGFESATGERRIMVGCSFQVPTHPKGHYAAFAAQKPSFRIVQRS